MNKPSLSELMQKLKAAEARGPKNAPSVAVAAEGTSSAGPAPTTQAAITAAFPPGGAVVGAAEPSASGPVASSPQEQRVQSEKTLKALNNRRFVTELLRPENRYNAGAAYNKVFPGVKPASAQTMAVRMLSNVEVLDELDRQLKGIDASADLDEAWVYRQWRSIANANMFDVLDIDKSGKCHGFRMAPEDWSIDQQLAVSQLTFHNDGRLKTIRMVSREKAVDSIAKARKMFIYDESGTKVEDMAKLITERMHAAAKRTGRTFDHETGQIVRE